MPLFVPRSHHPSTTVSATHTAATSTGKTIAQTPTAPAPTNVIAQAAEDYTQAQLAHLLNQNYRPLPAAPSTPINIASFAAELVSHPNQEFVSNLIYNLQHGFDIGYTGPQFTSSTSNLSSASSHPHILTNCIITELQAGHMAGPFLHQPLANFRTSPIGAVPKKNSTAFRMITDLSSPHGSSINDYITPEDSTVHFTSFDHAALMISRLGRHSLMAKVDVKSAFRICPVLQSDWNLLGIKFLDKFFVDLRLPFGLRSSVNRFTRISDTVLWILKHNYNLHNVIHYLDDFFLAAPPHSSLCNEQLQQTISIFQHLGIPLAPEKVVGPTTCITYLGIEIDSENLELRLPADKFSELLDLVHQWSNKKKCTKRDLLSLIGKLSFASKVVPSGRTFLRRLIDLSTRVSKLHHRISLNNSARLDIHWWLTYLPTWNGRHKILDSTTSLAPSLHLFTDACQESFGVFFNGKWISESWPARFLDRSIQWKELYPIFLSCLIWGNHFSGKRLLFHCDNKTVVDIWQSGTSHCPYIMSLIRKLFHLAATSQYNINIQHIRGIDNTVADCLSRLQLDKFYNLVPAADLNPTALPPDAWNT